MRKQTILYVSGSPLPNRSYKVDTALLRDGEKLAFNLHKKTVILLDDANLVKQEELLTPIEAHLFLFLLHFYPSYAPDAMLEEAWNFVDLDHYYAQLSAQKKEVLREKIRLETFQIQNGIERLRKKLSTFGLSVIRVRNAGYYLGAPSFLEDI